uniref:Enkurin domain-containing protein n=1 Tax=Maylandia zebra TaxID=106582 RepID=A0A3P9DT25_9CICH
QCLLRWDHLIVGVFLNINWPIEKIHGSTCLCGYTQRDKQLLEKSGLVPFYLQKNDYGIVPGYLRRRKAEKEKAKQDNDAWLTKQQETVKPLAEQEKQNILQGLKRRFNELNFEYQSLPFTISPSQHKKYNYKMFLEEAMSQVEKDIALFEEHKYIYHTNNSYI